MRKTRSFMLWVFLSIYCDTALSVVVKSRISFDNRYAVYRLIRRNLSAKGDYMMENISELITQYLFVCQKQRRLSEKTIKAYRIDLTQFAVFLGEHPAQKERDIVASYVVAMNQTLKPRSVKRKAASIRAFYNYLEREDQIDFNPFNKLCLSIKMPIQLPRTIPQRIISQMLSEVYADLRQAKTPARTKLALRNAAVLELLFSSGMRVSELCALNNEDVDLVEGTVRIWGKGAKERMILIGHPDVLSILQRYKDAVAPAKSFFLNRCGNRITDQSIRSMVNRYALRVHAPMHITPHMFRHSFATLLMEADVDTRYIQQILGHSSITTTQIYTHVSMKKQRDILIQNNPRNRIAP